MSIGRVGGVAASAVAATPFVGLWVLSMRSADEPLTLGARLDMAMWMAVFGTPWMVAARLLWRAWWRRAGDRLSALDGPGWLLAAAAATLPADRRDWGRAMTAELAQVQGGPARWRFAAGCARAAIFAPRGHRAAVGVAACVAFTIYYLAEHPSYDQLRRPGMGVGLPPVTAVVLAVVLAGCLWLALRPPRWLVGDRRGGRFGVGMALAVVAGFVLVSRQELHGAELDVGMMDYLLLALPVVLLAGSAVAAAVGRSFRAGLWACACAVVLAVPLLVAAWLAEALRWHQQRGQLLLDGEGGSGWARTWWAPTWATRPGGP